MSLRDLPIAVRLAALGAIGVTTAAAIGGVGLVEGSRVDRAQATAAAMASLNQAVTAIDVEHSNSQLATRDAILATTTARLAVAQTEQRDASAQMNELWATVRAVRTTGEVSAALDDLHLAMDQFMTTSTAELPTLGRRNRAGMSTDAQLVAFGKRVEAVDPKVAGTEDLLSRRGEEAGRGMNAALSELRMIIILALVLGSIVVTAAVALIGRGIRRPLTQLADASNRLAQGDFAFTIEVNSTDEGGKALAALDGMKATLTTLVDEMNRMSAEHDRGDTDVRLDAAGFQGGYRDVAQGLNEMVAGHILLTQKAMAVVAAFGEGDFSAPLEQFPGKKAAINVTVEQVRGNLEALIADVTLLSGAAVEGLLDTRADADRHAGGFRTIVTGFNATLDAVIRPLGEVGRVLKAMEDGDLTQSIPTAYRGQLEELRQAANLTVATLSRTFGEVTRVLKAMENGDLTQTITTEYRGEFEHLRQATNNTVTKLASTVSDVTTAADQLSRASGQVASASQSMSQSATEQAASIEETSASIEQMAASISQNSDNAKITDGIAGTAASEAAEGGKAVQRTVEAMKEIASKIAIVDDIAFQTNMLALNATIEAARAGEHGKGFAVVATEVGKLAERSQVAAQEIGRLAAESVHTAEKAGSLLAEIVPGIGKTSDLIQEIAAASSEQTVGVSQINSAMNQMTQTTQQNASSSEELAATAQEMTNQADRLQQLMDLFDIGRAKRVPAASVGPAAALTVVGVRVPPAQVRRSDLSGASPTFDDAKFNRF